MIICLYRHIQQSIISVAVITQHQIRADSHLGSFCVDSISEWTCNTQTTTSSFSQLLRCLHYSIQADLDMPDLLDTPLDSPDTDMEVLSSGAISRQYSRDAATSTVSIQGSGNHYHACASDDYEDVGFDPSILPPPDPWIDSVTDDPLDVSFNSSAILEVCGCLFSENCSRHVQPH